VKKQSILAVILFGFLLMLQQGVMEASKNMAKETLSFVGYIMKKTAEIITLPFQMLPFQKKGDPFESQDSWCQTLSGLDSSVARKTGHNATKKTLCSGNCEKLCQKFGGVINKQHKKIPMQTPDGICYCCCNK
jgi:hypothetical protein